MLAFFIWILFIDYFTVEKEQKIHVFIANKAGYSNYAGSTCLFWVQEVGIQPDSQTFGWDLIEKDISKNKYLGMRSSIDGLSEPSANILLLAWSSEAGGCYREGLGQ